MKPLRTLGVIGLTAAALSLLSAGSASATVLCKTNTSPCTSQVTAGTKAEKTLTGTSVIKAGAATVECTASEMNGTVENAGGSTSTVSGKVETLKFSSCNCPVTTIKSGTAELHWISGSTNGTETSAGAEVTAICAGITCTYGTGGGTSLGTLTGGEAAKLDVSATLAKTAGGFLCSSTASWTATYEIKAPKPLYVTESASSATSTSLTTSLSGEGKSGEEITVTEGAKVKDTATLSGTNASKATGAVKYKVYADKECKELVTSAGEVTVTSGSVPASEEKTLEAGRVYYWQAEYGGDSNNLKSTSTCGKEVAAVKAGTSLTTNLSGGGQSGAGIEVEEADGVTDSATLSGTNASKATGTAKYNVYSDEECKELVTSAGEVSVSGTSVPASSEEKLADGFYYWQATYEGDSTHLASTSACGSEIEIVGEKTTVTTTLVGGEESGAEIEVEEGVPVADEAALSGTHAAEATGNVAYFVYSDSECKELVAEAGIAPVEEEGTVGPSSQVDLPGGTYYWRAEYYGDPQNKAGISTCGGEKQVVTLPPLTTILSGESQSETEISVEEKAPVTDTATINEANASTATGTVKYKIYADEECKELVTSAGEVTVLPGGSVPASSEASLSAGVYFWQAEYSGDLSHAAATSACGTEVEVVSAKTTLTTSLSGEGKSGAEIEVRAGAAVSDTATLAGTNAKSASGTVVYSVYEDSKCENLAAEGGSVEVSEGVVPASSAVKLPAGTYYWQAEYSGDSLNRESTSSCGGEVAHVGAAALSDELSGGGAKGQEIEVEEETSVTDTATLHIENASTATGKVKYAVYSDNECKELVTSAGEVTLLTGGVIPASGKVTLGSGVYYWQSEYSGDETHAKATSNCGEAVQKVNLPWIVSVGDSYISGEGGRWAGNVALDTKKDMARIDALGDSAYKNPENDEKGGEAIALCHRSRSAEIFIGAPGVKSKNLACSGAETRSLAVGPRLGAAAAWTPGLDFAKAKNGGRIDPNDPKRGICRLVDCKGQATLLEEFAEKLKPKERIKMAVISIGGNDFGFPAVVKRCVEFYVLLQDCSGMKAVKDRFEAGAVATNQKRMKEGIENIGKALVNAGYKKTEFTLLVQNYPSAIPENGAELRFANRKRLFPGRCPFRDNDLKWANETALKTINETVKKAAEEAGKNYTVKMMRIEGAFDKRRLCETGLELVNQNKGTVPDWTANGAVDKTEWINQIRFLKRSAPFEIQEDFHPDYWGQLALRNCVRQAYNSGAVKEGTCGIEAPGLVLPANAPPGLPPEPRMKLK